jgi:hypothetical protein
MAAIAAITPGQRVTVADRKGIYTISNITVVPIPTVEKGEFKLVERLLCKFIFPDRNDNFCSWGEDCKPAPADKGMNDGDQKRRIKPNGAKERLLRKGGR